MSTTWLFYDVESSDLNKVFGQILQFAAIRTDEEFNEIECHEFFVRLNKDTLPSPEAVLVHRILPDDLVKGKSEYEALKTIHEMVNQPGTMNGGYNTLGYDDDVLRFGFYRNFLTPYSHGFANGCKRFDLFPMLLYYYFDGFQGIEWPKVDGKVSLKLENLNSVNGWVDGQAHDALVDVRVCVALARVMAKDHERWTEVFKRLYEKNFKQGGRAIYLSALLGSKVDYAAPVVCVGQNKQIKSTTYWLRLDKVAFSEKGLTEEALLRKKVPDTSLIVPEKAQYFESELVQENLAWLDQNKASWHEFVEETISQVFSPIENIDVDAGLYQGGFFTDEEVAFMSNLHALDPSQWLEAPACSKRLYPMVVKWLWRHHWSTLDPESLSLALKLGLQPGNDFQGRPKVMYAERLQRIEELIKIHENDEDDMRILTSLKRYYVNNLSIY